ncbi:hypothetical protein Slin15195_G079060 [Septoria linicola]|uniref:Uncharacterized protein n=1 Tax=Septoria linicola TaxID=215465 RepID=A0A9Q9ELN0_9PEZI|nr:hypothetical protein Slin14017_G040260 [Septoria linicola]USW54587.1 hypothetical protein Slin15195_G079060 [Septoria linicola]
MLYNSWDESNGKGPVIVSKYGDELQQGGFCQTVSMGDVSRIRQLYPTDDFDWTQEAEDDPGFMPHAKRAAASPSCRHKGGPATAKQAVASMVSR